MSNSKAGDKRKRKAPPRYKDNALPVEFSNEGFKWCTVFCLQSNKQFLCKSSDLEDEELGVLAVEELYLGKMMIWKTPKGTVYQVKVMKIHDKKPSKVVQINEKVRQVEDSSPSEDEDEMHNNSDADQVQAIQNKQSALANQDSIQQLKSTNVASASCSSKQVQTDEDPHLRILCSINSNLLCLKDVMEKCLLCLEKVTQDTHSDSQVCNTNEMDVQQDEHFTTPSGVNLLTLKASDPGKYALNILPALFSDEEMSSSSYKKGSKSDKPPLSPTRVALLEECVDHVFGKGTVRKEANIIAKKCNQKCLDVHRKMKMKILASNNKQ